MGQRCLAEIDGIVRGAGEQALPDHWHNGLHFCGTRNREGEPQNPGPQAGLLPAGPQAEFSAGLSDSSKRVMMTPAGSSFAYPSGRSWASAGPRRSWGDPPSPCSGHAERHRTSLDASENLRSLFAPANGFGRLDSCLPPPLRIGCVCSVRPSAQVGDRLLLRS